jgi:hypothetical protein
MFELHPFWFKLISNRSGDGLLYFSSRVDLVQYLMH